MTTTPLFHETARQLWVNGQISRPTLDRLVNHAPAGWPQLPKLGCDCLIPNNPANLERNREIIRTALAEGRVIVDGDYIEGLNARLDRLG